MAEPVRLGWPSAPFSGPAEWDRGSRAARKSPACSDRVRLRDDRHAPIMARSRASNQLSDSPNPKCWHGPSGLGRDCESSASSQPSDEAGNNVHTGAYAISALACGVLSTSCADESHDQGLRRRRTEPVASRRGPRELRAEVRRYRRTTKRARSLIAAFSLCTAGSFARPDTQSDQQQSLSHASAFCIQQRVLSSPIKGRIRKRASGSEFSGHTATSVPVVRVHREPRLL